MYRFEMPRSHETSQSQIHIAYWPNLRQSGHFHRERLQDTGQSDRDSNDAYVAWRGVRGRCSAATCGWLMVRTRA